MIKKECFFLKKKPKMGGKKIHRGISKKSGGIGLQLVKSQKRKFRPNLQRCRVKLPDGRFKRLWVSSKAIKAGLTLKNY